MYAIVLTVNLHKPYILPTTKNSSISITHLKRLTIVCQLSTGNIKIHLPPNLDFFFHIIQSSQMVTGKFISFYIREA